MPEREGGLTKILVGESLHTGEPVEIGSSENGDAITLKTNDDADEYTLANSKTGTVEVRGEIVPDVRVRQHDTQGVSPVVSIGTLRCFNTQLRAEMIGEDDGFEMAGGWELPEGYDNPGKMTDETLIDEVSALGAHWSEDALTDEQEHYYEALRRELLTRMSTQNKENEL